MQVGRNDPCPCGSGKKYKRCCLPKDEEARRQAARQEQEALPSARLRQSILAKPPDPRAKAFDARLKLFEEADYEGQIALFLQTLEERELMDREMAFEMLNLIFPEAARRGGGEREHFLRLMGALREQLPEVFAEDAGYYLDWQLATVLATGDAAQIPALMRELAPLASHHIDTFNTTLDRLYYHGHLEGLLEGLRSAWPEVKKSRDIIEWGKEEFSRRGFNCEIFAHLESPPGTVVVNPELVGRMEFFCEPDAEGLEHYLAVLTGREKRAWKPEDFILRKRRPRWEEEEGEAIPDTGAQHLYDLTVEFLGYLRREEGVPYTRGEVARACIHEYIWERFSGELEPEMGRAEKAHLRKLSKGPPQPGKVLWPDRGTLDRYLAGMLSFFNLQYYKVAATFELVPAWLRFLESRQLLDAQRHAGIRGEMGKLRGDLEKLFNKFQEDPAPARNIQRAWEQGVQ